MSALEPLPYYRWFVRDHRANRRVQRMGYLARGLQRELLDELWLEGSLSTDLRELADICGCPLDVMQEAWPSIAGCFIEVDGRLVNMKLEAQRTEVDACRVKRIAAGRLGGIAKQMPARGNQLLAPAEEMPYSNSKSKSKSSVTKEPSRIDAALYISTWNELRGTLPKCLKLTQDRSDKLQTRIAEGLTLDLFRVVVKTCAATPFLRGEGPDKWIVDFDWILRNDGNATKILEGKYGKAEQPGDLGAGYLPEDPYSGPEYEVQI